jgi:predicted HTH domain antitoxin
MAINIEEINALLRMSIYRSKEDIITDAIRALFESKPQLKVEIAVDLYKNEEVSLWRAADIAGMTMEEFKEILSGRGIKIEVGGSKEESKKRISKVVGD